MDDELTFDETAQEQPVGKDSVSEQRRMYSLQAAGQLGITDVGQLLNAAQDINDWLNDGN